ncbi:primosomal protein N' [Paludibacterium paludis]|uniref:primosomal protein N' n=1 Tax=Paludibacterium paludis TaxID=1225769 RepID=UPI001E414722|nr:primosomal protein N' [Paludibacterium paludis]
MQTVEVAVDVPLHGTFTYLAREALIPGQRVLVPFGRRKVCGIVANAIPREGVEADRLKEIEASLAGVPPLPPEFFSMVEFAARYYHYPFGQALFTALPTSLREARDVVLPDETLYALTDRGVSEPPPARQTARRALWQALCDGPMTIARIKSAMPRAGAVVADWLDRGLLKRETPPSVPFEVATVPVLNDEQAAALAALSSGEGFRAWVLQGITGSGKTEVYLRRIEAELAAGRQVLILVPEINLTPQLVSRFAERFPRTRMALLHSELSDGERLRAWVDAWQGRAGIVIGTRMSVFVPLPKLGLIIVDEEHDGSFKQQDGLRYHARDLAVWRARRDKVPVVLGSATPSLETVANIRAGRYERVSLTRRAHGKASLPVIHLLDVRHLKRVEGLAEPAIDALRRRIERREMSLVYINRRGFAPVVACTECGWISGCPGCSARLVVHLLERVLRCHHCGHEEPVPRACPSCGNIDIKPLGEGTQRLESALERMFPEARVLRIDRDTTARKHAWDAIYRQVHAGEVDILVGTQMLAKGHDFGALSLVVVLNADGGLYSADYRAGERLFSQLVQVAGRAGRADVPGEVLVQTQWAEHPLYQALRANDFDGFTETQLAEREAAGFPPSTFQAVLRADAPRLGDACRFLESVSADVAGRHPAVLFSGPAPALMMRLANRERAQLILEAQRRAELHACLDELSACAADLARRAPRALRWSLDIDPQEL